MSIEELQSDFTAVESKILGLNSALATAPELVALLKNELVPLMGSLVRELSEVDEAVGDIFSESEDILQPETAGLFATLIITGRGIAQEMAKLSAGNPAIVAACNDWLKLSKRAEKTLEEITVVVDEDPEDPESDEEDDDEDGDDATEEK